jgi:hypothetical protein
VPFFIAQGSALLASGELIRLWEDPCPPPRAAVLPRLGEARRPRRAPTPGGCVSGSIPAHVSHLVSQCHSFCLGRPAEPAGHELPGRRLGRRFQPTSASSVRGTDHAQEQWKNSMSSNPPAHHRRGKPRRWIRSTSHLELSQFNAHAILSRSLPTLPFTPPHAHEIRAGGHRAARENDACQVKLTLCQVFLASFGETDRLRCKNGAFAGRASQAQSSRPIGRRACGACAAERWPRSAPWQVGPSELSRNGQGRGPPPTLSGCAGDSSCHSAARGSESGGRGLGPHKMDDAGPDFAGWPRSNGPGRATKRGQSTGMVCRNVTAPEVPLAAAPPGQASCPGLPATHGCIEFKLSDKCRDSESASALYSCVPSCVCYSDSD